MSTIHEELLCSVVSAEMGEREEGSMPSAVVAQLTTEPAPLRPQDRRRRPSARCPLRSALRTRALSLSLSLLPSLLSLIDRAAVAKG